MMGMVTVRMVDVIVRMVDVVVRVVVVCIVVRVVVHLTVILLVWLNHVAQHGRPLTHQLNHITFL